MEGNDNAARIAANAIALSMVVVFALIGLWDGFVSVLHPRWPLVSTVIREWFGRVEVIRFLAWLLVYHLFVQKN